MASPAQRSLAASIGALTQWSRRTSAEERTAYTAVARAALQKSWERKADPEGVLPPDEVAAAVERLKKAHYARMALKSAQARAGRRTA